MARRPKKVSAEPIRGPRQFLRYPEQYGVVEDPQPTRLSPSKRYQFQAARMQHEVAREVNEQMTRLEITYEDLANQIGIGEEQVRRLLRGESALSAERMHQLAQAVGLTITITVDRAE